MCLIDGLARAEVSGAVDADTVGVFCGGGICYRVCIGSFQTMMFIYAGGVIFTSLLTVPNWPFFNRHPLTWLEPTEAEKHPKPEPASSSSKKKNTKK
ncbi:hypothetical protein LIER_29692 [Lithospermum erythrorhizon]|uniref:Signal peptidase complex subunit 1 n=1 Tax=Lithospermum erythrorhizon TaxID=34254 RepID=A0AAV3RLS0_LITER